MTTLPQAAATQRQVSTPKHTSSIESFAWGAAFGICTGVIAMSLFFHLPERMRSQDWHDSAATVARHAVDTGQIKNIDLNHLTPQSFQEALVPKPPFSTRGAD
jgi:hypothetical protein